MCGEVFSSNPKFTPEFKARVDQPHPLARPGRWSVVAGNPRDSDRAFFDYEDARQGVPHYSTNGFATKAEAEAALAWHVRNNGAERSVYAILPPAETFGDHDAGRLDVEELIALGNAILNNDAASYEKLRQEYADKTRVPGGRRAAAEPEPTDTERVAKAYPTRIEAADALVRFLTDDSGRDGNPGDYLDLESEAGADTEIQIDNDRLTAYDRPVAGYEGGALDFLRDLVRAYQNADE